MADNLCGPSAPTKGLVGHLNGDRTMQQDRVVNGPTVASSSTFRSTTQASANVSAGDAAFAAFTASSTRPQAIATHPPPALQEDPRTFSSGRTVRFAPDPRPRPLKTLQPFPAIRGGFDGPAQANTSWVRDFERMQLDIGAQASAGNPTAFPHQSPHQSPHQHNPSHLPPANMSSVPNYTYMGQGGQMMLAANVGPMGPSRLIPVRVPGSQTNLQAGPSTEHFDHYPQAVALAANTEEALDAAFAAYDNDFRAEMDQWVAQHGPDDRDDHDAIMESLADDLDDRRRSGDPRVLTQKDPDNRAKVKAQDDKELRKYAAQILTIMAEGNDKFKKSSFNDLMRRIVNHEVVIEGNELIDVATGEPTDLAARDLKDQPPVVDVPSTPTAIIPPSEEEIFAMQVAKKEAERKEKEENDAKTEDMGKGKEKEMGPVQ